MDGGLYKSSIRFQWRPQRAEVMIAGVMFYRGIRTIHPDDMRGVSVGGSRLTGKAYRHGKFARRRDWGSGKPDHGSGKTAANRFRLVRLGGAGGSREPVGRSGLTLGARVSGGIAMGSLVMLWLVVALDITCRVVHAGADGWSGLVWPATLAALVLTHFFGFLCDALSGSRCEWGMRALVGFWISILGWLPLGIAASLIAGLLFR